MELLLDNLQIDLENGDLLGLDIHLTSLTIDTQLPEENYRGLLLGLLELAGANVQAIRILVEHFRQYHLNEDLLPLTTEIFLWVQTPDLIAQRIATAYPLEKFIIHVTNLIHYLNENQRRADCARLEAIYGAQPGPTYGELYTEAQKVGALEIAEWLRPRITARAKLAEPQPWVKDFGLTEVSEPRLPDFPLPEDPMEAAQMLQASMGYYNIETSDDAASLEILAKEYEAATLGKRKEMLAHIFRVQYVANLEEDPSLFRMLGPCQAIAGFDPGDPEHPCFKYGGCRMLVCQHEHGFDDPDEIGRPSTLFKGACDYCNSPIEYLEDIIRYPLTTGSWWAQICSEECYLEYLEKRVGDLAPSPIDKEAVTQVLLDLKKFGIQRQYLKKERIAWPEIDELDTGELTALDFLEGVTLDTGVRIAPISYKIRP